VQIWDELGLCDAFVYPYEVEKIIYLLTTLSKSTAVMETTALQCVEGRISQGHVCATRKHMSVLIKVSSCPFLRTETSVASFSLHNVT
jgi:hypothetical protein